MMSARATKPTPIVLLVYEEAETARRWSELLASDAWQLVTLESLPPRASAPHVVVTEMSPSALSGYAVARRSADDPDQETSGRGVPDPAIVFIGDTLPEPARQATTSVCLPADFAPRELQTAVRLLVELVDLRRRMVQREQEQLQLARQAATDPLTSIPNRRAWDQAVVQILGQRTDGAPKICIAMFDVDQLKPVNDQHGHAAGDRVLVETAASLRSALRQSDFVARLGGDEFGVLLKVPNRSTAAAVVERVRQTACRRLGRLGFGRVTTTAGYIVLTAEDRRSSDPGTAMAAADAALREAKRRGRDCSVESAGP